MAKTVEFLFDFGSPTTYLAWTQLPRICADAGATLVYRPILLGAVFQATGNASPAMIPAKAAYMGADLARFAKRYGVPFAFNPHFPINTMTLMRIATGLLLRKRSDERMVHLETAEFFTMRNGRIHIHRSFFDTFNFVEQVLGRDLTDMFAADVREALRT